MHTHRIAKVFAEADLRHALLEAGNTAPCATDIDRNDRIVGAFDDSFEALLEGAQHASSAQCAFGEDADEVAVIECGAGGLERFEQLLWVVVAVNQDDLCELNDTFGNPTRVVVIFARHQHTDAALLAGNNQYGIHQADMVAN